MIATELKAKRTNAGLSQLDLERLTGIGRTYISLYENGRVLISEKHLKQLDEIFETVDLEDEDFDDEFCEHVPLIDYREIREQARGKLVFAPPGLLWGIDEDRREIVEQQVLSEVLQMLTLLEEALGELPFLTSENPEGSVGEALYQRLA